MSEQQKEELLQALEGAANFMRGMQLDPNIGHTQKLALARKTNELEKILEKHT